MSTRPEGDRRRVVIPPAVQAMRMQRYSVYLLVIAFLLVGANYQSLTLEAVLWFAAGLSAAFSILCAICVVILNGLAWNFGRLREELRGGRSSQGVVSRDEATSRPTWHGIAD